MDEALSLGRWVRRRRKALDLTQAEPPARVGCSAELPRKIEADTCRPSRQIAVRLAEQMQLDPGECEVFVRAARAELAPDRLSSPIDSVGCPELLRPSAPSADQPAHNLPAPLTPLIGRERELANLAKLLHNGTRLITMARRRQEDAPASGAFCAHRCRYAHRLSGWPVARRPGPAAWPCARRPSDRPRAGIHRAVRPDDPGEREGLPTGEAHHPAPRQLEHLPDAAPLVGDLLQGRRGWWCWRQAARLGLPGEQFRKADEATRRDPPPPLNRDDAPWWLRAALERWNSDDGEGSPPPGE